MGLPLISLREVNRHHEIHLLFAKDGTLSLFEGKAFLIDKTPIYGYF
jgi:hypothetical protein